MDEKPEEKVVATKTPIRACSRFSCLVSWKKMKPFERWTLFFQVIAVLVGCGVFRQLRQGADEIQSSKYATANSWILDLDKALLEKPELRPYFYSGKAVPQKTDKDYQQVEAMSEYMLDTFDSFMSQRFADTPIEPSWKNSIIFSFNNSPALTNFMAEHLD